jgi:hypothetical protein
MKDIKAKGIFEEIMIMNSTKFDKKARPRMLRYIINCKGQRDHLKSSKKGATYYILGLLSTIKS